MQVTQIRNEIANLVGRQLTSVFTQRHVYDDGSTYYWVGFLSMDMPEDWEAQVAADPNGEIDTTVTDTFYRAVQPKSEEEALRLHENTIARIQQGDFKDVGYTLLKLPDGTQMKILSEPPPENSGLPATARGNRIPVGLINEQIEILKARVPQT